MKLMDNLVDKSEMLRVKKRVRSHGGVIQRKQAMPSICSKESRTFAMKELKKIIDEILLNKYSAFVIVLVVSKCVILVNSKLN